MDRVKVSVIVPCYNSGIYLEKSLKSLFDQYHQNIEIVCVNDGSTDDSAQILESLAATRDNMKIVTLEENGGLFHARIAGVERATGEYIAFMDSDDRVTRDWIGALVRKAERCSADLVFGDMMKNGEVQHRHINPKLDAYYNLDPVRMSDFDTDGMGIFDLFMSMHGLCSHYHYVWNKLIRKSLWEKCLPELLRLHESHGHLVMGEDIAFSATFFLHAEKVVNIHNEHYIYCVHEGQSVDTSSLKKLTKNIGDLKAVFDYLHSLIETRGLTEKYGERFLLFKQRYGMIYLRLARSMNLPDKVKDAVSRNFALDRVKNEKEIKTDLFLGNMTNVSVGNDIYRALVDMIHSDRIKLISFDIFDTLVVRPFAKPMDMFNELNGAFAKLFGIETYVDFTTLRHNAEQRCHMLQKANKPGIEEPTMDDIYDVFSEFYGFDREKLREMQRLEIECELRYCYPRKAGIELFETAKATGKKVILASDMYLPRSCMEAILKKCGIEGYDRFYLSNEMHLTKHSGRMYRAIAKDYAKYAAPSQMLHIGDNYDSDFVKAKGAGWQAQHFPAAMDLLKGANKAIQSGKSFDKIIFSADRFTDMEVSFNYFSGLRSAFAVVANRIFDFPYVNFNKDSDLNDDPRFIGAYVGMHIFALARWLINSTRGKGIRKIHFAARDGWLVKQAYDILAQGLDGVPESNYIRVSRKSFAIADVRSLADMHSIGRKLNFASQTPDSIFELFRPVMSGRAVAAYEKYRKESGGASSVFFSEFDQFSRFLVAFYRSYLQDADFAGYQKMLGDYFGSVISEKDVFFDIGYSGRVELALNRLLGFKIRSYYVHSNNESLAKREELGGIENVTFYPYKPYVTGVIREHLISELAPSTIGYRNEDGELVPVFDTFDMVYSTYFLTKAIQDSALSYVREIHSLFGTRAVDLLVRDYELSRPFEYYLHSSRSFDRNVLQDLEFEDDFGEGHTVSGIEFWDRCFKRIHAGTSIVVYQDVDLPETVKNRSKLMRGLYFFLFDRKRFFEKLRNKLHKKS